MSWAVRLLRLLLPFLGLRPADFSDDVPGRLTCSILRPAQYVYIYIYVDTHIYIHVYVIDISIYIYVYLYTYTCTCICMFMYYVHMYMYAYICYIYMYVKIYIYVYKYICMQTCACLSMHTTPLPGPQYVLVMTILFGSKQFLFGGGWSVPVEGMTASRQPRCIVVAWNF